MFAENALQFTWLNSKTTDNEEVATRCQIFRVLWTISSE